MHILIALLTAIGGLLWALYRLQDSGVNLNAFNPFYWLRRRRWEKLAETKPLHRLDKPMDAAAVVMVGLAKVEGEISREQKSDIIELFISEFGLTESKAGDLFAFSAYLLRDITDLAAEIKPVFAPCKQQFSGSQVDSLVAMLERIATLERQKSAVQAQIIEAVVRELKPQITTGNDWQ